MTEADRTGVVLAGGRSTRFGDQEKALVSVAGEPMLRRVVARLGRSVDTVVVNCRADQQEEFAEALDGIDIPIEFAIDPITDRGPLAGIRTAFEAIESEYATVVACDMPGLSPDLLDYLFEQANGHEGAIPEQDNGRQQPVQAVYQVEAMQAVAKKELNAGRRSLNGAVANLDTVTVPSAEVATRDGKRSLQNINTPEEMAAFERELS